MAATFHPLLAAGKAILQPMAIGAAAFAFGAYALYLLPSFILPPDDAEAEVFLYLKKHAVTVLGESMSDRIFLEGNPAEACNRWVFEDRRRGCFSISVRGRDGEAELIRAIGNAFHRVCDDPEIRGKRGVPERLRCPSPAEARNAAPDTRRASRALLLRFRSTESGDRAVRFSG